MKIDDDEITQQIIPAPGWYAKFETPEGLKHFPLVCWALQKYPSTKAQHVGGFYIEPDGLVSRACVEEMLDLEWVEGFRGYVYRPNRKETAGLKICKKPGGQ